MTRSAVCQGYSLACKCLCRQEGLPCELVTSEGINNAWNLVTLGGEQFYVDCTWDDPSNHWYEGYCTHENFLCSRDAFGKYNHTGQNGDVHDWTCNDTAVYDSIPGSAAYASAWFKTVNTPVAMLGGLAAYADDSYSNGGADNRGVVYLRTLSTDAVQTVTLAAPSRWKAWGEQGFWKGNYTTFTALGGSFYYTTPTQVYRMDTAGARELVYTQTQAEQDAGYLYGIVNDGDGDLQHHGGPRRAAVPLQDIRRREYRYQQHCDAARRDACVGMSCRRQYSVNGSAI